MPKVARQDPSLCFMIAVSPAINWTEQGRYNTLAQLRAQSANQTDIDNALARGDLRRRLLEQQATFEQYTAAVNGDVGTMTADRWAFITKNFRSDATRDLAGTDLRILLILAGHDINVDVADTRAVYERVIPNDQLEARFYPGIGTPWLVQKDIEDSAPCTPPPQPSSTHAGCSPPTTSPTCKSSSNNQPETAPQPRPRNDPALPPYPRRCPGAPEAASRRRGGPCLIACLGRASA